ncbi:stealth family protein, partial [Yinghuangia aomiensis]|uniref:stealth family protein n=1 Tax=Yinghuangia aomiensis TaxID=676205 RepID=UPI0031E8138A
MVDPSESGTAHPAGSGGSSSAPKLVVRSQGEGSPAVHLYRKFVPVALRDKVSATVSPQVRNKIVTGVGSAVPKAAAQVRRGVFNLRHARHVAVPGRLLLADNRAVRVAEWIPGLTPLSAHRRNFDRVRGAFDTAGVRHFSIRGKAAHASVVAVRTSDRRRALDALQTACDRNPGYLAVLRPGTKSFTKAVAAFEPSAWAGAQNADVARVFWLQTADQEGSLSFGEAFGCEIEFWDEADDRLVAPRPNRVADSVAVDAPMTDAREHLALRWAPRGSDPARDRRMPEEFTVQLPDDIPFPIDAVYTWVDGSDPAWNERRDKALAASGGPAGLNEQAANDARYISRDELRFSLRSLDMYAPWIRTIYLVTDQQTPDWLDTSHPRVKVVDHRDIFTDPDALPTFNSHAIESQLHHIDGLAEHFLYFNDDVFLGRALTPDFFFHANGLAKHFPSP